MAQDVHWAKEGAYTGEVSARMLAKLAVSYVIVGHSERRRHCGEDDRTVNRKARVALSEGIVPIVAVGETLAEREAGSAEETVGRQVSGALARIPSEQVARLVVAYEPVWAIGTGRHARPSVAQEMISYMRDRHPIAAWRCRRQGADHLRRVDQSG